MPAGNTYESIATQTISGSSTTSVTFSSIPSTYTDLVLIASGSASMSVDLNVRLNGDTSTNYSRTVLSGSGSAAVSVRSSNLDFFRLNYDGYWTTSTQTSVSIAHIMNYTNTTTFKTILGRSNNATTGVDAQVSLWRKTPEAVNSIQVYITSGNYTAGSTFSLYGIRAA